MKEIRSHPWKWAIYKKRNHFVQQIYTCDLEEASPPITLQPLENKKLAGEVSFSCQIGSQNTKLNYRWKTLAQGGTAAVVVLCAVFYSFSGLLAALVFHSRSFFSPHYNTSALLNACEWKANALVRIRRQVQTLVTKMGSLSNSLSLAFVFWALPAFSPHPR